MPQDGSLIVRVFLSQAQLPIEGATVIVALPEPGGGQKLEAIRVTDRSGATLPIELAAPALAGSESPDPASAPFASYTILVEHPGYYLALFEQVQVFPGITTVQDVPLRPLPPGGDNQDSESGMVRVTPQPL